MILPRIALIFANNLFISKNQLNQCHQCSIKSSVIIRVISGYKNCLTSINYSLFITKSQSVPLYCPFLPAILFAYLADFIGSEVS